MKDLKHLIFFEDLLQQANNQLVQQAVDQGQIALGYNCYYIPEVLLNLPGCFSSRLRAPRSASPDIASYYMTGRNCPYVRCILERAIEGGYNYLGALFGAECCAAMERMEEHFQLLHPVKNDRFFLTIIDPPMKGDQTSLDYYKAQLQLKVLDALREHYGVDVSDDAIRAAVEKHNRLCRVITGIGDLRKLPDPPITGYEFHVIQLVSQVCPHDLILPYLEETLEELRTRMPEAKFPFRPGWSWPAARSTTPPSPSCWRCAALWWWRTATASAASPAGRRSGSGRAKRPSTLCAATICTPTSAPASCPATRSTSGTGSWSAWCGSSTPTASSMRA